MIGLFQTFFGIFNQELRVSGTGSGTGKELVLHDKLNERLYIAHSGNSSSFDESFPDYVQTLREQTTQIEPNSNNNEIINEVFKDVDLNKLCLDPSALSQDVYSSFI